MCLDGTWSWRNSVLPHLNYYTYLDVNLTYAMVIAMHT